MPNLYILQCTNGQGLTGSDFLMVVHYSVPSANNAVGNNYQTVLANSAKTTQPIALSGTATSGSTVLNFSGTAGVTILSTGSGPGQISSTDATALAAGQIFEVVCSIRPTGANLSAVQTQVATWATAIQAAVQTILQNETQYFGYTA